MRQISAERTDERSKAGAGARRAGAACAISRAPSSGLHAPLPTPASRTPACAREMPPSRRHRRKRKASALRGATAAAACPPPPAPAPPAEPPRGAPPNLAATSALALPQPLAGALLFDALPCDVAATLLDLVPVDQRLALRLICKGWQRWLESNACAWAEVRRSLRSRALSPRVRPPLGPSVWRTHAVARTRAISRRFRALRVHHVATSRADASQCDLSRVCWPRTSFLRDILNAAAVAAQRAGGGLVRLKLPGAERGMARLLAGDGKKCLLPEDVLPVCTRHML